MPRRPGFRRGKKPSLPFIQSRQYRRIALPQLLERIFVDHPKRYAAPATAANPFPRRQAKLDSAIV
jgi:hypothetical protein